MSVMQFLEETMRATTLTATAAYWAPLLDDTHRSYERAVKEELRAVAEKIVAAKENMYGGE